tara:strand:+ start:2952 stop:3227 length:276 start_codon:yes stop_codon:yes gene_type:complete
MCGIGKNYLKTANFARISCKYCFACVWFDFKICLFGANWYHLHRFLICECDLLQGKKKALKKALFLCFYDFLLIHHEKKPYKHTQTNCIDA